jgi:hypothetical protein
MKGPRYFSIIFKLGFVTYIYKLYIWLAYKCFGSIYLIASNLLLGAGD